MEINKQAYQAYVKEITPTHSTWKNVLCAFVVGGGICTLGQILTQILMNTGMDEKTASAWTLLILIGSSVILTGCNIYPKIVKFGGAGALVPITGFANSVAAPAIEYQAEGQVFGIGCKIFTIAGPVILYGILSSWILGIFSYLLQFLGIMNG
ncbi:MAG: SpoVA/SpoVAEb family sporulation membrane protein [Hungatella sp.]